MNVALKEWASVVRALANGVQVFILRKGGIVEAQRGGFELRYPEFLLFPTFEHQQANYVRREFAHWLSEPATGAVPIQFVARAVDVLPAPGSAGDVAARGEQHIWTEAFFQQRYQYRPDLPLHLIVLRIFRLPEEHAIPLRPSYAGCKSWVHLSEEIPVEGAKPVLSDGEFEQKRRGVLGLLGAGRL